MLKISRHVENYNMCRKLCWNSMLKISHVLNTVTLAESHVKTSRHVENVYVRHVENHTENHVEVWKKDHHTLRPGRNWAADFVFLLRFARVTEVRHMYFEILHNSRLIRWFQQIPEGCIPSSSKLYMLQFQLPPPDAAPRGGEWVGPQMNRWSPVIITRCH